MRILIATDAWRPQVNGVVSTLERMTQAAAEFGVKFGFLTPEGMWTAPSAHLPGHPCRDHHAGLDPPADRRGGARPYPHRHRGSNRLADAALLREEQTPIHYELSHPFSRVYSDPHRHP